MTVRSRILLPLAFFFGAVWINAALSVPAILAKFRTVDMPYHSENLNAREKAMVNKLVEANRLLDDVYWRQSDMAGMQLYETTPDKALQSVLMIMGGPAVCRRARDAAGP